MSRAVGSRIAEIQATMQTFLNFLQWFENESGFAQPDACDFVFGNPHEMPLPVITDALTRWAVPQSPLWFAYKNSEPQSQVLVAASLRARFGIDFDPADIAMTTGAFGAIAACLRAIVDDGDEVIYLSPPWFFYPQMIMTLGAVPVRVDLPPPGFGLPLSAIEDAITSRTRAIIVNSPHNPTGRILQPDELVGLADVLERASEINQRPVYLLSDESYSRILFDGAEFHTPLRYYKRSFLLYTYGKALLAPGQRIGYIAMPPTMPDRVELRQAILAAQIVIGFAFPNALMQYSLIDLDPVCIDLAALQRRRDRAAEALGHMGYEVVEPAGTFYMLVKSPIPDDEAFAATLARDRVLVLPGAIFELPGWIRLSLTANDDMLERALPVFEKALSEGTSASELSPSRP